MSPHSKRVTAALIAVTAGAGALAAAPLLADSGQPNQPASAHNHGPAGAPTTNNPPPAAPTGMRPPVPEAQQIGIQIGVGGTREPGPNDGPNAAQTRPGAQGGWGRGRGRQFRVNCDMVKSGTFDPIVFPGVDPAGHVHQFFGNEGISASSTPASLVAGNADGDATSCDMSTDGSAYWVPALLQDSVEVLPDEATLQYRAPRGQRRTRAFPVGLTIIAGDKAATTVQARAGFRCEYAPPGTALTAEVPTCAGDEDIVGVVTFPNCWDGTTLSATDQSHMAYATTGARCPTDHPVAVPELRMETYWPSAGAGHTYTLSSGNTAGLHADFMNGWDQTSLRRQVRRWLNNR